MRRLQKIKRLFYCSLILQFIMSFSILLMPIAVNTKHQNTLLTILVGLIFWLSAITGYLLLILANSERKWFINHNVDGNVKMNCYPGIITFFTNVPATVADVTMIVSFLIFLIIGFTKLRYEYISYFLLFLLVFSLHMHCMFNGRIYKITKIKHTRRKTYE